MNVRVIKAQIGHHAKKYPTFLESVKSVYSNKIYVAQFYIGSNKSWKTFDNHPSVFQNDISKTRDFVDLYSMKCFIHSCLLHNLNGCTHIDVFDYCIGKATPSQKQKLEKEKRNLPYNKKATSEGLAFELDVAVGCGFQGVVVHIGSGVDKEKAFKRIGNTISSILDIDTPITETTAKSMGLSVDKFKKKRRIILENSAGEGNKIGSNIEEISQILSFVKEEYKSQISVCIDTCHLFSAGDYNISKTDIVEKFFIDFDNLIGLDKLKVIHLNDSKKDFGCCVDRHETLTEGKIWSKDTLSLKKLIDICCENEIPMVLETPYASLQEVKLVHMISYLKERN